MSLHYEHSDPFVIFGSKNTTTLATTSIALTSAYQSESAGVPTKSFKTAGMSKLNLDLIYTMGAAETSNSIEIKFEGSPDGTNWYRIPNEAVSGGTSTITAREFTFVGTNAAAATISIGLDIFYRFMKVSAKETGVAANAGTVYGEVTLLGK